MRQPFGIMYREKAMILKKGTEPSLPQTSEGAETGRIKKRSRLLAPLCCFLSAACITAGFALMSFAETAEAEAKQNIAETNPPANTEESEADTFSLFLPDCGEKFTTDFLSKFCTAENTSKSCLTKTSSEFAEKKMTNAPQKSAEMSATQPFAPQYPDYALLFLMRAAGFILLAAGAVSGIFFIFVFPLEKPFLYAETQLGLLLLLIFAARELLKPIVYKPLYFAAIFLGLVILLCSLRELCAWIKHRLSLDRCLLYRFGNFMGKERPTKFAAVELTACIAGILGFGGFIAFTSFYPPVILPALFCLFLSGIAVCCMIRQSEDMGHLKRQINLLYMGNSLTAGSGAFENEEKQLVELRQQIDEAIDRAVKDERFKVELISNVSHDLRTPLTAILGYGELLKKEQLSAEGQEQLDKLNEKAGYMKELVEELFELTKVSSGVIQPKREEIDLIRLLEQTLGLYYEKLKEAGLEVRRHYSKKSIPIITDGGRIHQVFANLVGNAVKYSLKNSRIHLEAAENDRECRVRITNIASYEMDFQPDEITQRFARGDKARSAEGSGLGLAIAKTYTQSVGGSFEVQVDGEQFSAVTVLPLGRSE